MRKIVHKNLANAIVLVRVLLVFWVLALLGAYDPFSRIAGVILLAMVALLDWADGHVAHRFKISSRVGGLLDTLGDRITENVLFIFFAYKGVVPLYVPLFYVPRSFFADFVRTLSYSAGLSTFEVNASGWGRVFVASPVSRVLYLVMKMGIFFGGAALLVLQSLNADMKAFYVTGLQDAIVWLCALTVVFSAIRFIFLLYDSRAILKQEFLP